MQAFAGVTLHAGEVTQAGGSVEVERIDAGRAHQFTQLVDTLVVLVEADGKRLVSRRSQ